MKLRLIESKTKQLNIKKEDVLLVGIFDSEEVSFIPENISTFDDWYWTSDDDYVERAGNLTFATAISPQGKADRLLSDEICEVRPFIDVNIGLKNLHIGDVVSCFGYDWKFLNEDSALGIRTLFCEDSIGQCQYSSHSGGYLKSDLKKFVDDWWESVKDEPTHDKHFEAKIYKGKNLIDTLYSNDFKEITDMIDEEIKEGHWVEFTNKLNGKSGKLTPEDLKD